MELEELGGAERVETEAAPATAVQVGGSPVRGPRFRWAVAAIAVAGVAIGTFLAISILSSKPLPEALAYLPGDSVIVVELRPDLPGDQQQHLGNLLAHFPGFADQSILPQKLDEALARIVDSASGGSVDYTTRVKPLIAGPLAIGVRTDALAAMQAGRGGGLIVATTDGSVTCDAIFGSTAALETHRGVELRSITGGQACAIDGRFALFGDQTSIDAGIDAHLDHTGADHDATFTAARDRLDGDQLGVAYVDLSGIAGVAASAAPPMVPDAAALKALPAWMIAGLRVVDDAVQVEVLSASLPSNALPSAPSAAPAASSAFAALLPSDAFGFVEIHGPGVVIQRGLAAVGTDPAQEAAVAQLEQALAAVGGLQNVVGWIDDLGIAAIPNGTSVGAVALLRGTDATATAGALAQIHNLLVLASAGTDITMHDADHNGVTITKVDLGNLDALLGAAGLPATSLPPGSLPTGARASFSLAADGDVLLIGVGDGTIERVLDTQGSSALAGTSTYGRAVGLAGTPNDVQAFVALDTILPWVEGNLLAGSDLSTFQQDFEPYLTHLAGVGEATTTTSAGVRIRLVLTVK
jgi:hypothetical protein